MWGLFSKSSAFPALKYAMILAWGYLSRTALIAGVESKVSPIAVDETARIFLTAAGFKCSRLFCLLSKDFITFMDRYKRLSRGCILIINNDTAIGLSEWHLLTAC